MVKYSSGGDVIVISDSIETLSDVIIEPSYNDETHNVGICTQSQSVQRIIDQKTSSNF